MTAAVTENLHPVPKSELEPVTVRWVIGLSPTESSHVEHLVHRPRHHLVDPALGLIRRPLRLTEVTTRRRSMRLWDQPRGQEPEGQDGEGDGRDQGDQRRFRSR